MGSRKRRGWRRRWHRDGFGSPRVRRDSQEASTSLQEEGRRMRIRRAGQSSGAGSNEPSRRSRCARWTSSTAPTATAACSASRGSRSRRSSGQFWSASSARRGRRRRPALFPNLARKVGPYPADHGRSPGRSCASGSRVGSCGAEMTYAPISRPLSAPSSWPLWTWKHATRSAKGCSVSRNGAFEFPIHRGKITIRYFSIRPPSLG